MDRTSTNCRLVCPGAVIEGHGDLQPSDGTTWTEEFTLGAFVDLSEGDLVSLETGSGVRYPARAIRALNTLGPDGCAATTVVVEADLAA